MRVLLAAPLILLVASGGAAQFGETAVHDRPIPLPHPDQRWIRATSPNFTVISSADETRTRQLLDTLETVAGALGRVHPRFDARFTDTTVFVFNRRRDSQPYFELLLNQPRTSVPGAFVIQPDGAAAMVIDAAREMSTDRTIKHELMHNILAASGTRLPLWLEEGIAEYFSTTSVRGDAVIIGRPILPHYRLLRARGILPMADLLSARPGSPLASHVLFYPQSWALVEWMMRTNRRAFYAFVSDVEAGADAAETFRRHFSMDITTVARSFRLFSARPSASRATPIERKPVAIATSVLSSADALSELGQFLGRMNTTRDDAERYLRAALVLDPHHPRAIAAIGTLRAYDRRYAEAEPFFDEALLLAPEDPVILTAYAEALMRNSLGPFAGSVDLGGDAPDRFRRARGLVEASPAGERTPLAEAILGTSYLVEHDPVAGIAPLERARALRPARTDFALNLYALYLRAERDEMARQLFESAFEQATNAQTVLAARSVYVREHIARANRLAALTCYDDAIDVIKHLIDVTPDPTAKADLARDLAGLRRTADVNRQITTYNDAVAAYNRKQLQTALQQLDFLLTFATDDKIRGRAQQLRTTIRGRLGM
ncbi:MAG TPA: DUF1570 domain-containing protein [Thermoanaerobaculia bacterium]|nr:DUF1570 domain-containing protein [Thermoanaerobaculia bacterium]